MSRKGFTLIELMIVVAIIGVLAVIAGTAYRKYMDAGRKSEVYSMVGELRAKEEAYRAEWGTYLSTTSAGESDFYPALLAAGEPKAKAWSPPPPTNNWAALGVNPGKNQLWCGYVAVAGPPGAWSAFAGPLGKGLWNNTAPSVAWFYVNASCDNDGNPAVNSTFTAGSNNTTVYELNDHK